MAVYDVKTDNLTYMIRKVKACGYRTRRIVHREQSRLIASSITQVTLRAVAWRETVAWTWASLGQYQKLRFVSISCMNGEEAVPFVADFDDKVIALAPVVDGFSLLQVAQ